MKLSIVIVNWNTCAYLVGALRSIYESHPPFPFETIVVDNASTDGSAETVASEFPQVRLIANQENVGYARGNNQGMEVSTGDYVLLLNPDVVLPPGGLERALEILESRPDVGVLGVKLVSPDGRVQRSVRGFPYPLTVFFEGSGLAKLFPASRAVNAYRMSWFNYDREAEVDQPMGTFLLIRRKTLEDVGLMDERFPIFFNDVDWCYRAKRRGWKVLYSPDVAVTHYGGGSTRQVRGRMAWESRNSLLRFFRKHYSSVQYLPVYVLAVMTSWVWAVVFARAWRDFASR